MAGTRRQFDPQFRAGAIRIFIDAYNERCKPFTWTKTADHILAKADRQRP